MKALLRATTPVYRKMFQWKKTSKKQILLRHDANHDDNKFIKLRPQGSEPVRKEQYTCHNAEYCLDLESPFRCSGCACPSCDSCPSTLCSNMPAVDMTSSIFFKDSGMASS